MRLAITRVRGIDTISLAIAQLLGSSMTVVHTIGTS